MELRTLGRISLIGDPADDDASPAAQPKRLALLAYLALMSGRGPVRRDVLLALFWPELGDEEARRALRQGLHHLRRVVGDSAVLGSGEEVSVDRGRLRCDAVEFERLVSAGEPEPALSLYEGDFLEGFHVPDVSSEFEEWVDRTRGRLRRQAATAAWAAAEAAEPAGDRARALELGRRGCELEPDQEGGWRRLMLLQDRLGDRAGALRTYEELAARLRREFEASPSAETVALAARLRADASRVEEVPVPAPAPPAPAAAAPTRPRRWIAAAALAAALLVGAAILGVRLAAERADGALTARRRRHRGPRSARHRRLR